MRRRVGISLLQQPPALGGQPHEAVGVVLVAADPQHVAGPARDEELVLAASAPRLERFAQVRDGALDDVGRRVGRRLAPQLVDQPIQRHDLVRVQEEQRKNGPLLRAPER